MKQLSVLAVAFTLACVITTAGAEEDMSTGNYLLKACKQSIALYDHTNPVTSIGIAESLYCDGYLQGFNKGEYTVAVRAAYLKYGKKVKEKDVDEFLASCPPADVTLIQTEKVVVHYLENNPQSLHKKMYLLIPHALHEAWPCEGKK